MAHGTESKMGLKVGHITAHFLFRDNLYFCSARIIGFGDCYLGWIEAHRIYFVRNCVKMCFQFAL